MTGLAWSPVVLCLFLCTIFISNQVTGSPPFRGRPWRSGCPTANQNDDKVIFNGNRRVVPVQSKDNDDSIPAGEVIQISPNGVKIYDDPTTPHYVTSIQLIPSGQSDNNKPNSNNGPCPNGYGLHKESNRCFKYAVYNSAEEESPCKGPLMSFYHQEGSVYGTCDCKHSYLDIPRPIVYWAQTDTCYWLFDQGPCRKGEWLTFNTYKQPTCTRRICEENTLEDWNFNPVQASKKRFWFELEGECYKSDSTGFCANDKDKVYLVYDNDEGIYKKECKPFIMGHRTLGFGGYQRLPCQPGQKSTLSGECRNTATFE